MESKEDKGYLVIERGQGDCHVLHTDEGACMLTGQTKEELLTADSDQVIRLLQSRKIDIIPLEENRELWVLGAALEETAAWEKERAALEHALQEAREANKAKSSFLSNMSHDIRTPMNAIMGMTTIGLSHIDEKPRVQDCLLKIKTASAHLMSLVNDVLDMSRIDSGRLSLNEEVFSLADLIHDIAVIVRPQAAQRNHRLQIEIDQIQEEELIGDSLRLRQILVNIIGNAVKYTLENGEILVRFTQQMESEQKETLWLDFLCEDNGIGMSREFLERIFVPFERVTNTTTSKIEGTGLGMSIVKNLVDRMGGEIQVESEEGVGSRFMVRIPVTPAMQGKKDPLLPVGQSILLAESQEDRVEQITRYLKEGGLQPVCKSRGVDAVTWLTEKQYENQMPCALLLGQELEDMPALELAAHVRQLAGQEFPILLVSEADWAQLEYRATRVGVNAFVPCPLFKSRLFNTLSGLTNGLSGGNEAGAERIADYSGRHVLLVEDMELNQEIAVEMLSITGVQVEVADNGAEAVEKFEASPEGYFDLIFMDIQMPVMNGYDATKRIRQLSRSDAESVWIVAMTANAFVEDIRLSREAGMNEHCSKPIDPERLQEILRGQLK